MRRAPAEDRVLQSARTLRLVLQCRDVAEAELCEHLAFAFARDAGLRGLDVWYTAASAAALARHAAEHGGGEMELRVVQRPRPAVEVRVVHGGAALADAPPRLEGARDYMSELSVEWHAAKSTTTIVARKWLSGTS